MDSETLTSIYGSLITACVGGCGAIIAIVGIAMQRKTSREKNSLEFDVFYQTNEEVRMHWDAIAEYIRANKDKKNIGKITSKDDLFPSLIFVLNSWERASNAIRHNIYDEDYLYNVLGGSAIRIYDELEPFIKQRQRKNPIALNNFEWLVIRWRIRKKIKSNDVLNANQVIRLVQEYTPVLKRSYLHEFESKSLKKALKYNKKIKDPFKQKRYNLPYLNSISLGVVDDGKVKDDVDD